MESAIVLRAQDVFLKGLKGHGLYVYVRSYEGFVGKATGWFQFTVLD